jgi:drug/metabolite transporter (DMT)-like permease
VTLGFLFVICYDLMNLTIRKLGVSISVSLTRLSAVMPTVGSILLFGEQVQLVQLPGLVLAFVALPLSAEELPARSNIRRLFHGGLGWGLLLFVAMGLNDFVFKLKGEYFRSVDHSTFLLVVYIVALILCTLEVIRRRIAITRPAIYLGIGLGVVNYATAATLMAAMEVLPGMLAYPINGVGVILLSSISSLFLWKERLKRHNYVFVVLAVVAIWLINV